MSALTVPTPISQGEIESKSVSAVESARAIRVIDQQTYQHACEHLRDVINPMIAEVEATFDPICDAQYTAWKKATDTRKRFKDPLLEQKKLLGDQIGAYDLCQRRKQEEAERQAILEQERLLAEQTEAAILAAEAQGATAEEVQAIIEQPMSMPKPVVMPTHQKVSGIVTRKTFKARVVSLKDLARAVADGKVPMTYITANQSALDAAARSQGPELSRFVPGVVAETVASVASRGGR